MAAYKKRKFRYAEKYAIWHHHGRRCWLCFEPLALPDMSVDHFLPESFLKEENQGKRESTIYGHGLPPDFNINGYENLFPAHRRCNEKKGSRVFGFVPENVLILDELRSRADKVAETVRKIEGDGKKGRLFSIIMSELESGRTSRSELDEVVTLALEEPFQEFERSEVLLLNNGHWLLKSEIVREGYCTCERENCLDREGKMYCYHRPDQPKWVVDKGMYFECYDEIVECPRCFREHKRGHIGSGKYSCGKPYRDQNNQCD